MAETAVKRIKTKKMLIEPTETIKELFYSSMNGLKFACDHQMKQAEKKKPTVPRIIV